MAGIYIHIPYCKQACYYCDFHFSTNRKSIPELVDAIIKEIQIQKNYLGNEEIKTIYLGGGTPSILKAAQIDSILNQINNTFSINPKAEISLEANPDDINLQILNDFKILGINRLSIGIQTFNDKVLHYLNRAHSGEEAKKVIKLVKSVGYENFNLDLIYGISNEHHEILKNDIEILKSYSPAHISTYSLTIEPKTVFGNWLKRGKMKKISEDQGLSEYLLIQDALLTMDYDHYEVSNFAKPGYISKHNSNYWQFKPYLGLGPSAHSFNGINRQSNIGNNALYLKSLAEMKIPAQIDYLTTYDRINERILLGLRTKWGCNLRKIQDDFKLDLGAMYKDYLIDLQRQGLAELNLGIMQLTKSGLLIADQICEDLFLFDEKSDEKN